MQRLRIRSCRSCRLRDPQRRLLSEGKTPNSSRVQKPNISSSSTKAGTNSAASNVQTKQNHLDRLLKRTPKFLRRHVSALRNAPITHISAFLILHEITAVVPLFGLAGAFHYYHWLPTYFSEGAWVMAGVEMFGRYFRRKGWISSEEEQQAEKLTERGEAVEVEKKKWYTPSKVWNRSEDGVRIVIEFATAYAIVKALLIPRLMLSAWGAPSFARWTVIPVMNTFKKTFSRSKAASKAV